MPVSKHCQNLCGVPNILIHISKRKKCVCKNSVCSVQCSQVFSCPPNANTVHKIPIWMTNPLPIYHAKCVSQHKKLEEKVKKHYIYCFAKTQWDNSRKGIFREGMDAWETGGFDDIYTEKETYTWRMTVGRVACCHTHRDREMRMAALPVTVYRPQLGGREGRVGRELQ